MKVRRYVSGSVGTSKIMLTTSAFWAVRPSRENSIGVVVGVVSGGAVVDTGAAGRAVAVAAGGGSGDGGGAAGVGGVAFSVVRARGVGALVLAVGSAVVTAVAFGVAAGSDVLGGAEVAPADVDGAAVVATHALQRTGQCSEYVAPPNSEYCVPSAQRNDVRPGLSRHTAGSLAPLHVVGALVVVVRVVVEVCVDVVCVEVVTVVVVVVVEDVSVLVADVVGVVAAVVEPVAVSVVVSVVMAVWVAVSVALVVNVLVSVVVADADAEVVRDVVCVLVAVVVAVTVAVDDPDVVGVDDGVDVALEVGETVGVAVGVVVGENVAVDVGVNVAVVDEVPVVDPVVDWLEVCDDVKVKVADVVAVAVGVDVSDDVGVLVSRVVAVVVAVELWLDDGVLVGDVDGRGVSLVVGVVVGVSVGLDVGDEVIVVRLRLQNWNEPPGVLNSVMSALSSDASCLHVLSLNTTTNPPNSQSKLPGSPKLYLAMILFKSATAAEQPVLNRKVFIPLSSAHATVAFDAMQSCSIVLMTCA